VLAPRRSVSLRENVLLSEADGDGVYLKHGTAKNDFFGIFFAPTPSFHPFIAQSRDVWS